MALRLLVVAAFFAVVSAEADRHKTSCDGDGEDIDEVCISASLLQSDLRFQRSTALSQAGISPAARREQILIDVSGTGPKDGDFKLPRRLPMYVLPAGNIIVNNTVKQDNDLHDIYLPINSSHRQAETADILLLGAVVFVPFAIFYILKMLERIQEQQGDISNAGAEKANNMSNANNASHRSGQHQPQRRDSTYRIQEEPTSSSPLSFLNLGRDPEEHPWEDSKEVDEGTVLQNIFAGIATAMAALPDAISFSFITGSSPLNGIWAGVFMGFSAALIGGRPGMISSASAATAVVLADISTDPEFGAGPMALCVFLVGLFQIMSAYFKLSRFIIMVPHSVMLGFVNGLAIVMIKAQMRQFRLHGDGDWVEPAVAGGMILTAIVALSSAVAWSRVPVLGKVFPAPLASLIITIVFSVIFRGLITPRTLENVAGHQTFVGGIASFPPWDFPPEGVDWSSRHMWIRVILTAIRFALVGLLESLMTQTLIDQITSTSSSARRECYGQGVGNIMCSMFGTQGGCALIAQSLLNVSSGGHSRISGVVMAATLALSVIALAPVMAYIPVAALVGLIVLIALNTFAWGSLELIMRINWLDTTVVVLVTVITVWQDLAVAVVVGVIISTFGFAWHAATDVHLIVSKDNEDRTVIQLSGPLFFGSAMNYQAAVSKLKIEQGAVILDYSMGPVLDVSGIDAIEKARANLREKGLQVLLRGVPSEATKHLPVDVELLDDEAPPAPESSSW